jgi:hypothetical protein
VSYLSSDVQGGATLDLVAGARVLDHDAALRRVARASTAVDQESGATAHIVRARGVQVVAVVHALEGAHVAEGVGALREGAYRDLALAAGAVAARAGLATARTGGVNLASICVTTKNSISDWLDLNE